MYFKEVKYLKFRRLKNPPSPQKNLNQTRNPKKKTRKSRRNTKSCDSMGQLFQDQIRLFGNNTKLIEISKYVYMVRITRIDIPI